MGSSAEHHQQHLFHQPRYQPAATAAAATAAVGHSHATATHQSHAHHNHHFSAAAARSRSTITPDGPSPITPRDHSPQAPIDIVDATQEIAALRARMRTLEKLVERHGEYTAKKAPSLLRPSAVPPLASTPIWAFRPPTPPFPLTPDATK